MRREVEKPPAILPPANQRLGGSEQADAHKGGSVSLNGGPARARFFGPPSASRLEFGSKKRSAPDERVEYFDVMSFRIRGLDPEIFQPLYGLSEAELAARGARRCVADRAPGFPDRIEMRDAEVGETVLLVHYAHQTADTPYRSSHAVYVLEGADTAYDAVDEIPAVLRSRLLSVRSFDASGMMLDAEVVSGQEVEGAIERLFESRKAAYLHVHNAGPGCFAARIDRVAL
ncbi:MAG: DUF1203 domain-containing protein [Myxococcota bacterium]